MTYSWTPAPAPQSPAEEVEAQGPKNFLGDLGETGSAPSCRAHGAPLPSPRAPHPRLRAQPCKLCGGPIVPRGAPHAPDPRNPPAWHLQVVKGTDGTVGGWRLKAVLCAHLRISEQRSTWLGSPTPHLGARALWGHQGTLNAPSASGISGEMGPLSLPPIPFSSTLSQDGFYRAWPLGRLGGRKKGFLGCSAAHPTFLYSLTPVNAQGCSEPHKDTVSSQPTVKARVQGV